MVLMDLVRKSGVMSGIIINGEDRMFICDETGFVTVNHEKER